jgi:hypothetical protein
MSNEACKYCESGLSDWEQSRYNGCCAECGTMRNRFAEAALQAIIIGTMSALTSSRITDTPSGGFNEEHFATQAFLQADAMMDAQKK